MDTCRRFLWPALTLFFVAGMVLQPAFEASAAEAILVGRIAFIEGQVLRYVPDTQDWVATVKDAPFGIDDALYSDQAGRGEFIMPNGVWARMGGSTQMQLIALKNDVGELDVASGVARFYNKSSGTTLKVTTPYGYILSEPGSSFDLYVGDQSMEAIALDGGVTFIHRTNTKYDLAPGSGSIIADANQVAAGEATVDAAWDDWNAGRDSLWTKRTQVKGESVNYLPPQLQEEAYDLEQNGTWEKVYYEGEYRTFWRPVHVREDWRPFTVGRWTEWYGDQCWVPDEPFGYVTHHYGNWVIVNGRWFWAPPARRVAVVAAAPVVDYAWYPGRVAWISSGDDVGWVPLAPTEVYYSHRHWGPRAVLVESAPVAAIAVGALAFATAAVVISQTHFWGTRDYSRVRVTNIDRTAIVNNFHSAPVVNNTVIKNYGTAVNKYDFTSTQVVNKPHVDVSRRIQQNRQLAVKQAPAITAATVKHEATAAKPPTAAPPSAQQLKLPPPQVTSKIVPADKVSAPRDQTQLKPTELKAKSKPAPTGTPIMTKPTVTGAPGKPGVTQPGAPGATLPSGLKPAAPGTTQRTAPGTVTQPTVTGRPTPPTLKPGASGTQPLTTAPGGVTSPRTQPPPPTLKPSTPGAVTQPTAPGRPTTLGTTPGTTKPQTGGPTGIPSPRTQPSAPTLKPGVTGTTRAPGAVTQPTSPGRTTPSGGSPTLRTQPTSPATQGTLTPRLPSGGGPGTMGTQPSRTAPQTTQPRMTAPPTTQPRATQPRMTQPTVTQPRATQPRMTQPQVTQPRMTQPRMTQPPVTQPRMTQPQVTQPRATQPRMTQPPVTQPRATQPRMTQPPVTQPRATQPRVTAPPARQPTATTQPKKKPGEPGYVPGQ